MALQPSPNYSVAVGEYAGIVDNSGNVWYIQGGQVTETINPNTIDQQIIVDAATANVDAIAIVDGNIWQQAHPPWDPNNYYWWERTPDGGWSSATKQSPLPPVADGTVITPGNTPLVDAQGNLWWIADGKVVENGFVDQLTGRVIKMAYKGGTIYQENADQMWWAKTYTGYDGWGTTLGFDNPVPVDRTWVGGHSSNSASDPANWSPGHAPKAGDTLYMQNGGVMNVAGNALQGDLVSINGPVWNSAQLPQNYTFNFSGTVPMSLTEANSGYGNTTVNLADNSQWVGGFSAGPFGGGVNIQATNHGHAGTFANTSSWVDNEVTVNADVVGTGTFTTVAAHHTSSLQFLHGVSDGQTVNISGGQYGNFGSTVVANEPKNYHATTNLGFGELILEGVKADSYSYQNSMLSLFNGRTVVETLKLALLTDPEGMYSPHGADNFGVSMIAGGIDIHADGSAYQGGGELLPLHGSA